MEKQLYFAKVNLIKALEAQQSALTDEWNEYTCWYGTPEEQEAHETQSRVIRERLEATRKELEEARKDIPKETLKEWSNEFYNRK